MQPWFAQYLLILELEPVEIEFHGAPGVDCQQIGKILEQLSFEEVINLLIEIRADAPNSTGISLDRRLRLKPLEFQVFEMSLIVLLENEHG
ncbi:hypothetical protein [Methylotuvimicrobium sp.]|uniref:hypothetical protein n=1 Tax=Methylotuvimicrobium sp. TaxID=2822413 RepID=UPI003D653297